MKGETNHSIVLFPILALCLVVLALLVVWKVGLVSFVAGNPVDLTATNKAVLRVDTTDQCSESIKNSFMTEESIVGETFQDELKACVNNLRTNGKQMGAVSLPHEWRSEKGALAEALKSTGRVLYSISYEVKYWPSEGLGLWSIALEGVGQNAAVFLNNDLLGWTGSFEKPYSRNHALPWLLSIPDGFLFKGQHQFDIYVVSETPSTGFLDNVYIGPTDLLGEAQNSYRFLRQGWYQIFAINTITLSGFTLLLWLYRRQDVEFGLFGLMGLFWSIHTLDQFVVNIPLSTHNWEWLIHISLGYMVLCSILFVRRFLGLPDWTVIGGTVSGVSVLALVIWAVPNAWLFTLLAYVWYPLIVLGFGYMLVDVLGQLTRRSDLEIYVIASAVSIIFLLACHDFMVMLGEVSLSRGRLLHFGTPFLLFALSWVLLRRFGQSLQAIEQYNEKLHSLNQDLEARVEEKSQRIAKSYEMIRKLGQEQVVQQERSRIMRDMHDGIGVYLSSMLRQLELDAFDREHLRSSAHNALNDLRLMIDSLGNTSNDLPAMLGMFRTRISLLLEACQTDLEWSVDELPVIEEFGPERALNLLRILQEAMTNALKHADCNVIRLSAVVELNTSGERQIVIKVIDNGKGFVPQNTLGNGLNNMRHRAHKINAKFALDTNLDGTCITLTLPITRQQQISSTPVSEKNNREIQ